MVRGIHLFRDHFLEHADTFLLIGGVASFIAMDQAGQPFRATKDFDIVLYIEMLTPEFINHFWKFIKAGQYETRQRSTGKNEFFRFINPENADYPFMLELFSRKPDALKHMELQNLTPIPADDEISSLSAILMDDDY